MSPGLPHQPWACEAHEALAELNPIGRDGLNDYAVVRARERFGRNDLERTEARPAILIFLAQFRSLIVVLLAAAAVVSFLFENWIEGGAVLAVIAINALIGFFTELNATRSMEALRKLTRVEVTARRNGSLVRLAADELVPGDIVVVEGGDLVAADIRLLQTSRLQADESSLTGESVPVAKQTEAIPSDTILAERANMLFKGTAVTRGSGEGVVTSTGMSTELGKISSLVAEAEEETTPLEKRLDHLAHRLVWVTLVIASATALAGIRAGKEVYLMIETSIALAVAAIPEGLPIVATIALARGMWRMAHRNALINRLSAVETLGATNVICSDKTGTLTENQMTVVKLALADGTEVDMDAPPEDNEALREALLTGALCNNASLDGVGDPLEVALLEAAAKLGVVAPHEERVGEEAFDSESKMMATVYPDGEAFVIHVKGAAEPVIAACSDLSPAEKDHWLERNESLASEGLRLIALARKPSVERHADRYAKLEFLGLVAMVDPPREDIRPAIARCHDAGIQVVMITGDQAATAAYVADAVGLQEGIDAGDVVAGKDVRPADELTADQRQRVAEVPVFARVSPGQKLDLIETHQQQNRIVAMTGDGVNDAPALKKADIGIAMGIRGTEVAKEASDVVLKDDAFGTIVTAVEQGRAIFANIRRFVIYLMSCNLSEILIVGLAAAVSAPLPILPLQILFLNMVTDVFPALALGMGKGAPHLMNDPPRDPREPILRREDWVEIATFSVLISASVLAVFGIALLVIEATTRQAVSIAFLALAGAQLVHVFNMRSRTENLVSNQITRNRYVWWALAICIGLLAAALFVPALADVLGLETPSGTGWLLVAAGTLTPLVGGQIARNLLRR